GGRFEHEDKAPSANDPEDWLVYRHWDPILNRYASIHDHYAYNGGEIATDNTVRDLSFEAQLSIGQDVQMFSVMLRSGSDRFVVRVPVGKEGEIQVARNGRRATIVPRPNALASGRGWPRRARLEAAVVDRRLTVALDGEPLFEPLDY